MSWIALTVSDVLTGLTGPEKAAVQTAAKEIGQTDPLAETTAQTIQDVRGYVAACASNSLGAGDTIPSELKADAIALIRWRALNRLNVRSLLSATRETEYKDAIAKLRDVAACRFAVEQPVTVSDQVISGSPVQIARCTKRQATRARLDSL